MSNTVAPHGFQPVQNSLSGAWTGGFRTYPIASGYATSLFAGDVVKLLTTGYIAKAAAGDQMRGVVIGFEWIGTDGIKKVGPYFPAGTVTLNGADAVAKVVDDPNVVFEAQFLNSASVPALSDTGANFNLIDNGGNTSSGISGEGADYTTATTSAAQFRLIGFVQRPNNDTKSANSRGLFQPALHDFRVNTGI